MRASNRVIDGVVCSVIPADTAAGVARFIEGVLDLKGVPAWQVNAEFAHAISVMGAAPHASPEPVTFDIESHTRRAVDDVVTASEAAMSLGVTPQRVGQLCAEGRLAGVRRAGGGGWLIDRTAVADYVKERRRAT